MKFTKDEASEVLTGLLTDKGETLSMSQRSVGEFVDSLMGIAAGDDTEVNDFATKVLPMFKTANANIRNDNSAFAKNYNSEKEKELEALKAKIGDQKPPKKDDNESDDKLSKLLEEVTKLKEANEREKAEKTASTKRNELIKALKDGGIDKDAIIEGYMSLVTVTADTDVDTTKETIIAAYNKTKAQKTTTNDPTGEGGNGKQTSKRAQVAALKSFRKPK